MGGALGVSAMSVADFVTLGKTLGLPGVFVLVWYLLEKARGERQAKVDEAKVAADNRKTEAMEEGFRSLASMIGDHAQADQEAHAKQVDRLAAIETHLSIRKTPARGVTTEIVRSRSGDNR